jgi:hypothetical protein
VFVRVAAFVLASTVASVAAAAPTKGQCVDANTQAQVLRKQGSFKAARTALRTCSDPSCPGIVRNDCSARLDELARIMPSVILEASGGATGVSVTLDGEPAPGPLDGRPIEVDPGEHHIVFRAPGRDPVTRVVTLDEGEKNRRVQASFETPGEKPAPSNGGTLRVAGIAFSAAAVAGVGVGSVFGILSFSAWGSVKSECATAGACDYPKATSDRAQAIDFATASDVAFAIGGALAVTGAVLFALGLRAAPTVGPRTIGFVLVEPF